MDFYEEALKLHEKYKGKIEVNSKVSLKTKEDLCTAYTPGVAAPCKEIHRDGENAYRYTSKGNLVAVVTDGTAVLGLGNIGPKAAVPVMEGKAVLFKEFAGIDAFPICLDTQDTEEIIQGDLSDAVKDADIFIGVSVAGALKPEMIKMMAKQPIVFALANPAPEIMYEDAIEAGVAVMGTGRSDFPNQINNVLAFPGIFRGALDARARDITYPMKLAAAKAIAGLVDETQLRPDYIIPSAFDERVAVAVAEAVKNAAMPINL